MTSLVRHPQLVFGEGPRGFLLRLANQNGLNASTLKSLGLFFQPDLLIHSRCLPTKVEGQELFNYARHLHQQLEDFPGIWNQSHCRWCPECLREQSHWRIGWELLFVDACAKHQCWLIDRCDECGERLTWSREQLTRCNCGYDLMRSKTTQAPENVARLSHDLEQKFVHGSAAGCLSILDGLQFEQVTRLVRLVGSYGQIHSARLPQKIPNLGAMDVSWQITSIGAEVLARWPECFDQMLKNILDRNFNSTGQRFPKRFGFFYASIFKRFSEPEFAFLRTAFENFVATHWRGPLAKRNTRLSQSLLKRASWVPASHARNRLQVSRSRLNELVRTGILIGDERLSEAGRRYLMVRRDSMEDLLPTLGDQLTLITVCEMLGLTKGRLRSALLQLFPEAQKVEGNGNHWAISRSSVETLLHKCNVPAIASVGDTQVCFDHILRYWACSEAEIASLLSSLRDGLIKPVARLPNGIGLSHLVFVEGHVRQQIEQIRGSRNDWWTIPQVAKMLGIKQEVAYFLIRCGMLASQQGVIGRRVASMVSRRSLNLFLARYVFARDLAKLQKTSPRSVQSRLAEIDIHPVVAPLSSACRQVIYERSSKLVEVFGSQLQSI